MHKKEPQKPPEHASEHVKPQNFLGACPQTPLAQSILWALLFVFALGLSHPLGGPACMQNSTLANIDHNCCKNLVYSTHMIYQNTEYSPHTFPIFGYAIAFAFRNSGYYNIISLVVHNISRSACICLFHIVMIKLTMFSGLYFAFTTVFLQKLLIREREYFPDVVCDYQASDSCNPKQPTPSLLPASWSSWCQWYHGCELSTFDGSNEPCHFAAVDFVSTV